MPRDTLKQLGYRIMCPVFFYSKCFFAGITIYLLIVGAWFFCQQPPIALAPLFFADPAGAVFGKLASRSGLNKAWWHEKTTVGTAAVFLFAFASLSVPGTTSSLFSLLSYNRFSLLL